MLELEGRPLPPSLRGRSEEDRRAVQMVFQNADAALNRSLSIRSTLGRSLRRLADSSGRDAVADLATLVRLSPGELELRPSALSGGMKQRVAIARALAGSPSLVVCDEAVSDLDVSVQAAIVNLFGEIRERDGVSFVFISHDLAVVRYVADRIGVMYLGWLIEVGPADAVFAPPHHPYTEALVSAVPPLEAAGPRPRITLYGPLPSATDPPRGCRFHTRCPRYLGELCETVEPPWQEGDSGHRYRCHIPPRELGDAQRADRLAGVAPARAERPAWEASVSA
jgi:peptide/nickel transport system ATP-binding protein